MTSRLLRPRFRVRTAWRPAPIGGWSAADVGIGPAAAVSRAANGGLSIRGRPRRFDTWRVPGYRESIVYRRSCPEWGHGSHPRSCSGPSPPPDPPPRAAAARDAGPAGTRGPHRSRARPLRERRRPPRPSHPDRRDHARARGAAFRPTGSRLSRVHRRHLPVDRQLLLPYGVAPAGLAPLDQPARLPARRIPGRRAGRPGGRHRGRDPAGRPPGAPRADRHGDPPGGPGPATASRPGARRPPPRAPTSPDRSRCCSPSPTGCAGCRPRADHPANTGCATVATGQGWSGRCGVDRTSVGAAGVDRTSVGCALPDETGNGWVGGGSVEACGAGS